MENFSGQVSEDKGTDIDWREKGRTTRGRDRGKRGRKKNSIEKSANTSGKNREERGAERGNYLA